MTETIRQRRVAISIDLDWFTKHHCETFAGTQRFSREAQWQSVVNPHVAPLLHRPGTKSGFDGVVARTTQELAERCKRLKLPLVNVWIGSPVRTQTVNVFPDMVTAGKLAAEHFMSLGLRWFATIGYKRDRSFQLQIRGFQETLREHGCDCTSYPVRRNYIASAENWELFRNELNEWLQGWSFPIGIMTSEDLLARYLAVQCQIHGIDVPGDVALMGSGNEPAICLEPEPSISSIDLNYEQVGYQAAARLESLMNQEQTKRLLLVPPKGLVLRRSTDALAVEDELVAQALAFIVDQCSNAIDVPDVVQQLPASRRTLERRFQAVLGRSVADEITRARIQFAQRRLVDSNLSIKALALECGYSDAAQMCRVFTRAIGMPPGEYRKRRKAK